MTVPLTKLAGDFVAGMTFERIPAAAVPMVCNGFTDYAAVTILGRDSPVAAVLRSVCAVVPRGGEARVCFSNEGAPAAEAALINGSAGHAHDYDDVGLDMHPAHPTVVMAPAILAEAEALGLSGADMIAAYVAGYEVWGEFASRDSAPQHIKGWHPTATFGAIAAAAAAASLRRLDAEKSAHAIGIAASQAGGIVANFGSMTKPFHAGRAAQVGILSVRLAEAGMTASVDAIENPKGFLHAVSPAGELDLERPAFRCDPWWIESHPLGFKLYPMCYATHRSLAGMLELVNHHGFGPGDVTEIDVGMAKNQLVPLVASDPKTVLDAKFCEQFAMAMAVVARRATLTELSESFLRRADVQSTMKKVRITVVPGGDRPSDPPDDRLIVTLRDGRRLEKKLSHPPGHAERPFEPDMLWGKFEDCAGDALPTERARDLFGRLQSLDRLRSVAELPLVEVPHRRKAS